MKAVFERLVKPLKQLTVPTRNKLKSSYGYAVYLAIALPFVYVTFLFVLLPTLLPLAYERRAWPMWVGTSLSAVPMICFSYYNLFRYHGSKLAKTFDLSKGQLLDVLLPPDEAEHRILELDIGRERWVEKYGRRAASVLYVWHSVVSVALFWFDRVVVKVLARQ